MEEEWRTVVIDGEVYEGYEVSNFGRVRSLNYNGIGQTKILKQIKKKNGYLQIGLYKNGKQKLYLVHRLIAIVFIPNPNNLPQINHINEDKTDNRVENLEWCSSKYNANYGTRIERQAKTISKRVRCVETGEIFDSIMEVERKIGLPNSNVSRCCKGKRKTCGGYHWEYVD